ncbi:MAG: hypothetical protein HXS48_16570 [Theionarchaea archaeon]|nr:hypothetical protein [Theionarchaea archaeon]
MEDETKEEIEKKLREDDFIFGDYFQSVNPRREKFAEVYGRDESSDPSSSTTQPQSVEPSGSTTQPQSVEPSDKTSKTQKP